MSKILLLVLLIAQTKAVSQNIPHYETPSNPAFNVLGFEPSSVLRPTSPSELKANLLSFFDKNGKLLPNMGMEVSPYWLQSNPELTYKQYADPGVLQSIKQTFCASFATVRDSVKGPVRFATGMKFQILSGSLAMDRSSMEKVMTKLDLTATAASVRALSCTSIDDAIEKICGLIKKDFGDACANAYEREFRDLAKQFVNTPESVKYFIEQIILNLTDQAAKIDLPRAKKGVVWEIAGATAFNSANEGSQLNRYGVWTTIAVKNSTNEDFLLTARYYGTNGDSIRSSLDAGMSYVKDYSNFNLSAEGVLRWGSIEFDDKNLANEPIRRIEHNFTYRLAATIQYKFNDAIYFNISIGKNYAQPLKADGKFFSTAGLSFNLFRPSVAVKNGG